MIEEQDGHLETEAAVFFVSRPRRNPKSHVGVPGSGARHVRSRLTQPPASPQFNP